MTEKTKKAAEPTIETNKELYVAEQDAPEAKTEQRGDVEITTFVGVKADATVNEAV